MKIKKLRLLSPFRGLPENFEMAFSYNEPPQKKNGLSPHCFVGLNGSGKSNVLEVISEIFYYLETYHNAVKENLSIYKTGFGFEIEYSLPSQYIMASRTPWDELNSLIGHSETDVVVKIIKKKNEYPKISAIISETEINLKNNDNNRNLGILPSRVIAYSSGMNELLSNPFIKIDFNYFDNLKTKIHYEGLDMNRMFYLNYDQNKSISVCNFLFDASDYDMSIYENGSKATDFGGVNLTAIKRELQIDDIHFFKISLQLKKAKSENQFLHSELNLALENLKKCATFIEENTRSTQRENFLTIELVFWVNKATKEAFRYYFKTAYNLFRAFYFFNLLNIELISQDTRKKISNATAGILENLSDELPKHEAQNLIFRISDITFQKKDKAYLHYRKLSDGEHQLIQVFGSLLLMDNPASIFLLDEPETHFNPDWRSKFVSLANESIDSERQQEIILTTHSPYIISDCTKENVFVFKRNADGVVSVPENPKINTFGTSISILTSEVFGKDDSISEMSIRKIEEISSMDLSTKENIKKAKEASRILGESVEKVLLFKKLITKEKELEDDSTI